MILKSVEPRNFGPFAVPTKVEFEPDVTVLTGPNDTGKTFLLRLIELICGKKDQPERTANDYDVNFDRINEAETGWKQDREIGCTAVLSMTDVGRRYIGAPVPHHV